MDNKEVYELKIKSKIIHALNKKIITIILAAS